MGVTNSEMLGGALRWEWPERDEGSSFLAGGIDTMRDTI